MPLRVLTFNCRRSTKLVVKLMTKVYRFEVDICLVQELRAVMKRRLVGQEKYPEIFHYHRYPPVCCSVKGELVVFFSRRLTYLATIPLPADELQVVILKDQVGRYIGIVNCHFPDQKTRLKYFLDHLYPQLVYCLSSFLFGTPHTWGEPTPKVNVFLFGGDINQAHPDFVDLSEISDLRGSLSRSYRLKSNLLLFITRLFGLQTNLEPSIRNWTFGNHVFANRSFYRRSRGRYVLNVTKFNRRFSAVHRWLSADYPDFDLFTMSPPLSIRRRLRKAFQWRKRFSLPLFRQLYAYFLENNQSISGLSLEDIYFLSDPGWTDILLISGNVHILSTEVGFSRLDPVPRFSDHGFIEICFAYFFMICYPAIYSTETLSILRQLEENSRKSLAFQLAYLRGLFASPDVLIAYVERLLLRYAHGA